MSERNIYQCVARGCDGCAVCDLRSEVAMTELLVTEQERAELDAKARSMLVDWDEHDSWDVLVCTSGREFDLNIYDREVYGSGVPGACVIAYLYEGGDRQYDKGEVRLIDYNKYTVRARMITVSETSVYAPDLASAITQGRELDSGSFTPLDPAHPEHYWEVTSAYRV